MKPFLDAQLLATGPWIVPALLAGLVGIACLAGWLIEDGLHRRSAWRIALGLSIAGYPVAVALAAAGIIR